MACGHRGSLAAHLQVARGAASCVTPYASLLRMGRRWRNTESLIEKLRRAKGLASGPKLRFASTALQPQRCAEATTHRRLIADAGRVGRGMGLWWMSPMPGRSEAASSAPALGPTWIRGTPWTVTTRRLRVLHDNSPSPWRRASGQHAFRVVELPTAPVDVLQPDVGASRLYPGTERCELASRPRRRLVVPTLKSASASPPAPTAAACPSARTRVLPAELDESRSARRGVGRCR